MTLCLVFLLILFYFWRFDHFGKAPYKKLFVCMYVCSTHILASNQNAYGICTNNLIKTLAVFFFIYDFWVDVTNPKVGFIHGHCCRGCGRYSLGYVATIRWIWSIQCWLVSTLRKFKGGTCLVFLLILFYFWRFDHFGKAPYKKLFVCMYVCSTHILASNQNAYGICTNNLIKTLAVFFFIYDFWVDVTNPKVGFIHGHCCRGCGRYSLGYVATIRWIWSIQCWLVSTLRKFKGGTCCRGHLAVMYGGGIILSHH